MATTKITSPDLFNLESLSSALRLPSGTTAQRPTSPSTGEWRYNTTTNLVEFWDGGAWRDLQSEDIPPIPSENFNTVLYTGNGSSQSITGVGFKPDFVWVKDRVSSGEWHMLSDSTRGTNSQLFSNETNAPDTKSTVITSFDSDGFSIGSDNLVNNSGKNYVAWCWKANGGTTSSNTDGTNTSTVQANTATGFSIVSYTGTGNANMSYGHGLSTTPNLMIIKSLNTGEWCAFGPPIFERMNLNDNAADQNNFGVTATSTTIETTQSASQVGNVAWNGSGVNYISYCFASVAGYSSIGSYTGNGSTDGPIVNTGFEPAWLMLKRTDSTGSWAMIDNKRTPANPRNKELFANLSDAENTFTAVNFLTNGFQIINTSNTYNANGGTFLYIAFAADASAAPALADSFANKLYTGTGVDPLDITGLGFSPSLVWIKSRDVAREHIWSDSVRGPNREISSSDTSAEEARGVAVFTSDGFTLDAASLNYNGAGENYVSWNFKANSLPNINTDGGIQSIVSANQASGFSIVKWDGTGSASTVGHGLSAAPEIILTKRLNGSGDWYSFSTFLNSGTNPAYNFIKLNSSDAEIVNGSSGGSIWNSTSPTATVINVGTTLSGSTSDNYIAYCFTSISGFSKMGSYSGTGSAGNAQNVGFTPAWVMIKRTSSISDWYMFDTARGDTSVLLANSSAAEFTNTNFNLTSTGFDFDGTDFNEAGSSWIYMAFKENPAQPAIPSGYMAYLVVAGGGSGHRSDSNNGAGGGGAGGLRSSYVRTGGGGTVESNITLTAKTYTITIGAGGADNSTGGGPAISGSNSVLDTITSVGGGGGGGVGLPAEASTSGGAGGGGGGYNSGAGAAGTTNQGFAGGNGSPSTSGTFSERNGGGGGGAGSVGVTGSTSSGGQGGFGVTVPITGTNVGYAGGGSGANKAGSGIPSTSGGGTGAGTNGIGTSGTANTGGGGGGGGVASYAGKGGGSGVVILRMNTSDYSGATTGSPTVTTIGSETILTYTGSGTYVHS